MATLVFVALTVLGLALATVGVLSLRQPVGRLLRVVVLLAILAVSACVLWLAWKWVTTG